MTTKRRGFIALFVHHRVAANLLMALMVLAGSWALSKLNTQFFPSFELDILTIRVVWSGANAEDVETGITAPLEQALRGMENLRRLTSTSATGIAALTLEFNEHTAMDVALEQVNSIVGRVRNLPEMAEKPQITRITRYESIARLLLTGNADGPAIRKQVQAMRDELLARGISRVDIHGLPKQELAIEIPTARLLALGLSLDQIAERVRRQSQDIPAGAVGREEMARQLRSLDQRRDVQDFETLPIITDASGTNLPLGDIALIERRAMEDQVSLTVAGKPAVELQLFRAESTDSLGSARILESWLKDTRSSLPDGLSLQVYDQKWMHIKERIQLLLTNGGGGLILIVAILLIFLNRRVALWVAVGVPVSFMAALAVLYLVGGSINMISLFGLIMALGIIVDDAIVVGEDALAHFEKGEPADTSVIGGAHRMLAPVMASSLTTIAAFLPLMMVGGVVGNIMFDIPLVVICVIIASLIECFLILPGHLRGSFARMKARTRHAPGRFRSGFDRRFDHFRNSIFRRALTFAIRHRSSTLSLSLAVLIVAAGMVAGGRIGFTFFPNVEGRLIFATVAFTSGSPPQRVEAFLQQLQTTLAETESELGGGLIAAAVARQGVGQTAGGGNARTGNHHGSMVVELVSPENRAIKNRDFIEAWQQRIVVPAGVESFTIAERRAGHPGRDIDIRLTSDIPLQLKLAASELVNTLSALPGVSAVEDDLPWGQEQLIYHLTPTGKTLGLDVEAVGQQMRTAFDGRLVQLFQDGQDEVEVRVMLPRAERATLSGMDSLHIMLPDGDSVPLGNVIELSHRRGFDALRHTEGRLAVSVTGDVDRGITNNNDIREALNADVLPMLKTRYGVDAVFQGRARDQAETMADLRSGALIAFLLMYIILAWVFSSYSKPFVVMAVIPFGLVGAIFGHWVMDIELTVLSLFGFFGLSGIVVNDSIILVTFYQKLRRQGMAAEAAVIEAACQRLRAVLLTSLTTIAGLTPLLFETSLQAKFLIPMATTISFGLAFATVLVLVVVPTIILLIERMRDAMISPRAAEAD
ncbi:MAG: efflux RND transporter permease subunit [Gammaproteobacteria bacterium]|nr:efflux RND transporter permease subunit [Gammaproteobacteria bacterium]